MNLADRSGEGALSVALGATGPMIYHPAELKARSSDEKSQGNPSLWYIAGNYVRRIDLVERTVHTKP